MIRVGLLGASGRMGQCVSRLLVTEFAGRATLSMSAGRGGDLARLLDADVVIDFSSPDAMIQLAEQALLRNGSVPAFVVGSTGWTDSQRKTLDTLSRKAQVLVSSNFSTGVLALLGILRQASPLLKKLGYSPVLVDTHHRHKKDAPSGTAIALQKAITPSEPSSVQTHSVRAGETIGDHEVTFYGPADHLTFGHFAQDRSIFARGAIDVALWLAGRKGGAPGLIGIETYFEELSK